MPKMSLKQSGFTQNTCGPFTKNKKRIKNFKETGDSRYVYQNELDTACFQHDKAHGDFKDLNRRTAANKVLCDKAFNNAKTPKYDGYQRGLVSMVYRFFNNKTLEGIAKPVDVKSNTYIHSSKKIIDKYSNFKIGDIVRI